jgi:hypothetical protein
MRGFDDLTLKDILAQQKANLDDPESPKLYVASGVLSDWEEGYVTSEAYKDYPYAYLMNIGDAVVQRYDNGSARFLSPIDVVFEAREETAKAIIDKLYTGLEEALPYVNELRPGVRLASPFRRVGGYRAESRRKGFHEALMRLETSW